VADRCAPLVAERVHQRDQVVGEGAGVVPVLGLVGQPDAVLLDRDHLEVPGQRRHQQAPGVPALGPAVHQQQRRPLASDDRVLAQLTGVEDRLANVSVNPSGRCGAPEPEPGLPGWTVGPRMIS
jgi:hypothetical protein